MELIHVHCHLCPCHIHLWDLHYKWGSKSYICLVPVGSCLVLIKLKLYVVLWYRQGHMVGCQLWWYARTTTSALSYAEMFLSHETDFCCSFIESFFFLWLWLPVTSLFYPPCQPWPHLFGLLQRVPWRCHSHPCCLMPLTPCRSWKCDVVICYYSHSIFQMWECIIHTKYSFFLLWFLVITTGSEVFSLLLRKRLISFLISSCDWICGYAVLPWVSVLEPMLLMPCALTLLYVAIFSLSWNIFSQLKPSDG